MEIEPTLLDGLLAILLVGGATADCWTLYQKLHPGSDLSVWVFDDNTAETKSIHRIKADGLKNVNTLDNAP